MFTTKASVPQTRASIRIAQRLATVRSELFGESGQPDIAKHVGVPVQSWRNFEGGVTAPPEVILKVLVLFAVEPNWLLNGEGPTFRA